MNNPYSAWIVRAAFKVDIMHPTTDGFVEVSNAIIYKPIVVGHDIELLEAYVQKWTQIAPDNFLSDVAFEWEQVPFVIATVEEK